VARLKIRKTDDFRLEMDRLPVLKALLDQMDTEEWLKVRNEPYRLWFLYRDGVESAIRDESWDELRRLFDLYDAVEREGKRGEMFDSAYVAFVEDVQLPNDRVQLLRVLRLMPESLLRPILADRPRLREQAGRLRPARQRRGR
jgi:hypothetical protein